MKTILKHFGVLTACFALLACGGGSKNAVEMETVFRLFKQTMPEGKFDGDPREATFEYDSFGRLERRNHSSVIGEDSLIKYFIFEYDDLGLLLTQKVYDGSTDKLTRLIEYDEFGHTETSTRADAQGVPIVPTDVVYVNRYDGLAVDTKASVQRKIIKTSNINGFSNTVYPDSNLLSRDRSGTAQWIHKISIDQNTVIQSIYYLPDDGVVDNVDEYIFNDQDDIKKRVLGNQILFDYEYVYSFDANDNKTKRVATNNRKDEVIITNYTWEKMEILVQ